MDRHGRSAFQLPIRSRLLPPQDSSSNTGTSMSTWWNGWAWVAGLNAALKEAVLAEEDPGSSNAPMLPPSSTFRERISHLFTAEFDKLNADDQQRLFDSARRSKEAFNSTASENPASTSHDSAAGFNVPAAREDMEIDQLTKDFRSLALEETAQIVMEVFVDKVACPNAERASIQGPKFCNARLLEAPRESCKKPGCPNKDQHRAWVTSGELVTCPCFHVCEVCGHYFSGGSSNLVRHIQNYHTGLNFDPNAPPKKRVLYTSARSSNPRGPVKKEPEEGTHTVGPKRTAKKAKVEAGQPNYYERCFGWQREEKIRFKEELRAKKQRENRDNEDEDGMVL